MNVLQILGVCRNILKAHHGTFKGFHGMKRINKNTFIKATKNKLTALLSFANNNHFYIHKEQVHLL